MMMAAATRPAHASAVVPLPQVPGFPDPRAAAAVAAAAAAAGVAPVPYPGLMFSQEDVDMVLYGYARNRVNEHLPGHALSGLRIGELSYGECGGFVFDIHTHV